MKQLTLQFEGYADSWQPVDVTATTQRKESEVKALLVRALRTVSTKYANCKSVAVGLVASTRKATEQSEFLSVLGVPLLFSGTAPYMWAAVGMLLALCGLAEWLEGGAA